MAKQKPDFSLNFDDDDDAIPQVNVEKVSSFATGREDTTVHRKPAVAKTADTKTPEAAAKKPAVKTTDLPWEAKGLRDDVSKPFIIRFNEQYHAKLLYIKDHTPPSAHEFCLKALQAAIDAEIKRITKKS